MNWYCIKKYIPQSSTEMLIRSINKDEYERYFIASIELLDSRECLFNWDMANGAHHNFNPEQYKVTHFCPFAPIEDENPL